jgi:MFS family permease
LGDASLSIAGYAIVTNKYPDKKQSYLGYCSAARGLGCMLGPLFGQWIYNILSFKWTFYISAGIITPLMILAIVLVPRDLN